MALKFKVRADGIDAVQSSVASACSRAEHILAVQMEKDTAPFVPALMGSLMIRTRVDGGTIVYPGPYARFLYGGKVMVYPPTGSTFAPLGESKVLTSRDLNFNRSMHPQAQAQWFEASKAQNLQKWIRVADMAVKKFGKD